MSKYNKCQSCKGVGSHECKECLCPKCQASGKVSIRCNKCDGGKIGCDRCGGARQIIVKKGWFSDKYGVCPLCAGVGKVACSLCHGSALLSTKCPECGGSGLKAACARCAGTRRYSCGECGGAGRLITEWFKSLSNLTAEALRFEHSRRQREITSEQREIASIQIELSSLRRELDDMYNEYEEDKRSNPARYNEAGTYPVGLDTIPREMSKLERKISGCEARISSLEDDMGAIEEVLNTK